MLHSTEHFQINLNAPNHLSGLFVPPATKLDNFHCSFYFSRPFYEALLLHHAVFLKTNESSSPAERPLARRHAFFIFVSLRDPSREVDILEGRPSRGLSLSP